MIARAHVLTFPCRNTYRTYGSIRLTSKLCIELVSHIENTHGLKCPQGLFLAHSAVDTYEVPTEELSRAKLALKGVTSTVHPETPSRGVLVINVPRTMSACTMQTW